MVSKAKGRYIPISVRKIRLVANLIKGLDVPRAQAILANIPRGAAKPISKVFKSAVANATKDGTWTEEQLVVSKVMADDGPSMKRYRAAPMGRAMVIKKGYSHLTIELDAKKKGRV
jgi:large subunit ribosomal protein L22